MGCRVYRGVLVGLADVLTLGTYELRATPAALYQIHEKEKDRGELHVAFVSNPEDRILCHYDAAPGDQEGLVLGPLTRQVTYASDTPRCPSLSDCLGRGVAEMRRVAPCLDYTLTPEAAQRVAWVERIAEEVDAGRLTLQAGREALSACYLKVGAPCPFADDKGAPPTE